MCDCGDSVTAFLLSKRPILLKASFHSVGLFNNALSVTL